MKGITPGTRQKVGVGHTGRAMRSPAAIQGVVLALVALLLLLASSRSIRAAMAGEEQGADSKNALEHSPTGGVGTGFYCGAGWSREFLELKFDERASLPSRGVTWNEWGQGIDVTLGYGFSTRFRGELSLGGDWREAKPEGTSATTAVARFTGYVPLWTGHAWQPHLIGGFSGSFAAFVPRKGKSALFYSMSGGELGVGVRLSAGRHWAFQYDYIHTVLDLAQELFQDEDNHLDTKNVGRRGRAESLRFGATYDF